MTHEAMATLAETADIRLLHAEGTQDVCLLVFARPGEAGWAGAAAARQAGIELFLAVPAGDAEPEPDAVREILPALQRTQRKGRALVALGGPAALRHAAAVGARLVLAFAPRITTAPAPPRGCDVFLLADPAEAPMPWPGTHGVAVPGLAAEPDMLVASPERLQRLIALARARGPAARRAAALRAWARAEHRQGGPYLARLAARLRARGHGRWLAALMPRLEAAGLLDADLRLARAARRRAGGDAQGAMEDARAALAAGAAEAAVMLAELLLEAGDAAGARAALAEGRAGPDLPASLAPLRSAAVPRPAAPCTMAAADALAGAGDLTGAVRVALRAARAAPADPAVLMGLARLLRRAGADGAAAAALRAAVLADGAGALLDTVLGAPPEPQPAPPPAPQPAPRRSSRRNA